MGEKSKKKKGPFDKIVKYSLFGILVVIILFGAGLLSNKFLSIGGLQSFTKGEETIITKSALRDMVDVEELSSLKFRYNGIAEYKKKSAIRYKSTVKAWIDMRKIDFDVDDESKTVLISLPKINIEANTDDQEDLSFIPSKSSMDLRDALIMCENDAKKEAKRSKPLTKLAEDSLKSNVEALVSPLIDDYEIVWDVIKD